MVEITYQMVLSTLQTIGLLVGIVYYLFIMRNSQRTRELALIAQEQALETRQTQIFMQLYLQINSEETYKAWAELVNLEISDYDEYLQMYDSSSNPAFFGKRAHLWYSFNTIGEILRQGIIELEFIHRLALGPMVIMMWEKWVDVIKETRVRENLPEIWEGFEYLYGELKKIRIERDYPEITYPQRR